MVQMAHHLSGSTSRNQQQPSFIATHPTPGQFPENTRREFAQLSPEEMISYNRELAKAREKDEWLARQKNFELTRSDAKRGGPINGPTEDARKQDAYYRASQEYMRLMNEEPSRQTFREKQRLTEDLEKQKRLLIEDLARDQQLKQDKYNRSHHPSPASIYHGDARTMQQYISGESAPPQPHPNNTREVPLRLKPEVSAMYPFDARYPQHLASSEEFHNYRRMQEKMMKLGKHNLQQNRQCLHSDFRRYPHELGSIIQEKEKKLKEMEDKIVKLEHEGKIQYLKKIGVAPPPSEVMENRENAPPPSSGAFISPLPKVDRPGMLPGQSQHHHHQQQQQQQQQHSYRYASLSSSPPKSSPSSSSQQNHSPASSTTSSNSKMYPHHQNQLQHYQPPPSSSSASASSFNNNTSSMVMLEPKREPHTVSSANDLLPQDKTTTITRDNNNNSITPMSSTPHDSDKKGYSNTMKSESSSPQNATINDSNPSQEKDLIDEKQQKLQQQQNNDKLSPRSPSNEGIAATTNNPLNRQDSNCIKLESPATSNDASVTTEVVDDDKTFNVKYGGSQNSSPTKDNMDSLLQKPPTASSSVNVKKENRSDAAIFEETISEPDLDASGNRQSKASNNKKKAVKTLTNKRDADASSSPPDFQASQNRLTLDLPGHNWLEKRLMQQNALSVNNNINNDGKPKDDSSMNEQQQESAIQHNQNVTTATVLSSVEIHHETPTTTSLASGRELPVPVNTSSSDNKNADEEIISVSSPASTPSSSILHIPVAVTSKLSETMILPASGGAATKETPRSELLLKMLESETHKNPVSVESSSSPSSLSSTLSSSAATAVINLSHTVSTTSELVTALRSTPQKSLIVVKDTSVPSSVASHMSSAMYMKQQTTGHHHHPNPPHSPRSTTSSSTHDEMTRHHRLGAVEIALLGKRGGSCGEPPYQEVRPNLVLERRRDPESIHSAYPQPRPLSAHSQKSGGHPPQPSPHELATTGDYNKYIIEERYNRKRNLEDVSKEEREIALRRAEFSERFFSDLERGMMSKNKAEPHPPPPPGSLAVEHKDRLHSSTSSIESQSLPMQQRRSFEDPTASVIGNKDRLTKIEASDYNYLSKFRENRSPTLMYKATSASSDPLLKSPGSKSVNEYSSKRSLSPPSSHGMHRMHEEQRFSALEKGLHRRGNSSDGGIQPPVLNGRFDSHPFSPLHPHHHRRAESVDPLLLSTLQTRERELNLMEEARRREEIHRSAMEASRKERMLSSQSVPVNKMHGNPQLHPSEEHLVNLNEKVRTVEDLRALQLGMPLQNGFHRYIRPQNFRNERLTEREKIALREADFIQASLRGHESIVSRQDIHNSYLKHARRKSSLNGYPALNSKGGIGGQAPAVPRPGVGGFSADEHLLKRQHEDAEKLRARHHERMPLFPPEHPAREGFPHPKDIEVAAAAAAAAAGHHHFDPTIPRFFSHKIPRTRDGSLDFGRSKPVDYSFLDYSNPNFHHHEREAALHGANPLKRPSSAHNASSVGGAASETMAKFQRRSPPSQEFLAAAAGGKHRLPVDPSPSKHPGRSVVGEPPNTNYDEKWRVLEGSNGGTGGNGGEQKRFCSICSKDAQYLCSGCRKVWYCSQDCQLNAWKTHSKNCVMGTEGN